MKKPSPQIKKKVSTLRRGRHSYRTKEQFISLRATGLSFANIAKELHVGKQTLLNWNQGLKEEIENRRAVELEALREQFYLLTEKRIELFGEEVERIRGELKTRDYKDVPTEKLADLLVKMYAALKAEDVEPVFKTEEDLQREKSVALTLLKLTSAETTNMS